ncbi:ABC-three component system protein [Paenibacillus thermotolerans]|uniref:ABC-three component system protein n=1 Tax=Paenibacillus thermotolerans TaxID=3027807 RepID=UPI00236751AD|nr:MULTISPECIES: ABC-three component system protein [unclassified Paenibacillus]
MTTPFSAGGSAIGYLYQSRYALYLLLQRIDSQLSIEKLDDVAFEDGYSPAELLQLKHHLNSTASLTNACSDLWKTVRVWSEALKSQVPLARLTLVTTATVPHGSIGHYLKDNLIRDPSKARSMMLDVIATSESQTNQTAYQAFSSLTPEQQFSLVENMYILDQSPDIVDVSDKVKGLLALSVRRNLIDSLYERLEGWWFQQVIIHLKEQSMGTISGAVLSEKIHDIADQLRPDRLPIDYQSDVPEDPQTYDGRQFVQQLQIISLSEKRIELALRDYYRAFMQRSKWISDHLVSIGELERYEKRLHEAWEEYFEILIESGIEGLTGPELEQRGKSLYNRLMEATHLTIRPGCTEPYVLKGSYHILADKEGTPLGWHPHFKQVLDKLKTAHKEGAAG